MRILYLSCLSGNLWAGPTYSVPAQVAAQAACDEVFWYNLSELANVQVRTNLEKLAWHRLPFYHDLRDFPAADIAVLPKPFNQPDLIVFEQFYDFVSYRRLIRNIQLQHIPYVIIPRGELNRTAQRSKWLKKQVANWVFFYRFARRARAIEYLTRQEASCSGNKWNRTQVIIPNGVDLPPLHTKIYAPGKPLQLVFLGRIDSYHKGLDLLLQACHTVQEMLRKQRVSVHIYGPDRLNQVETLQTQARHLNLNDCVYFHEGVYGAQKAAVLQQADAFIMTSRFEGHPMGLIEALGYGLPCLVTTGTNMREEIAQFHAGWTADTTAQSIAQALAQLLSERSQFAQKSVCARALAEQYDWGRLAQQSHTFYEECIK